MKRTNLTIWYTSGLISVVGLFLMLFHVYSAQSQNSVCMTTQDGDWNNTSTWGGTVPTRTCDVMIHHHITITSNVEAKETDVASGGHLTLSGGTLDAYASVVVMSGGTLDGATGGIGFHVLDDQKFTGNVGVGDPNNPDDHSKTDFGLWGMDGSTVKLVGANTTSWLDATPKTRNVTPDIYGTLKMPTIDNGSATLAQAPTGWQSGDTIVLTNVDGNYSLAKLASVNGTAITYTNPSTPNFSATSLENDGKQFLPKVGNLTRRIKIFSTDVTAASPNHRAHTAFMGNATVDLENVEFRDLGPRGKLGRYPVHFHLMGNIQPGQATLKNSSIWQDVMDGGNRFVSIHSTNNTDVENNIALRSLGHGFFLEKGLENNNILKLNLAIDVRQLKADYPEELTPITDQTGNANSYAYWLHADNTSDSNVAVIPPTATLTGLKGIDGKTDVIRAQGSFITLPDHIANASNTAVSNNDEAQGCVYAFGVPVAHTTLNNPKFTGCAQSLVEIEPAKDLTINNPVAFYNAVGPEGGYSRAQVMSYCGTNMTVNRGLLVGFTGIHGIYCSNMILNGTHIKATRAAHAEFFETSMVIRSDAVNGDCSIELFDGPDPKSGIGKLPATVVTAGFRKRNGVGLVSFQNCTGQLAGQIYAKGDPNSPFNKDYTSSDDPLTPELAGTDTTTPNTRAVTINRVRTLTNRLGPAGFLTMPVGNYYGTRQSIVGVGQNPKDALMFATGHSAGGENKVLWQTEIKNNSPLLGYSEGLPGGTYDVHFVNMPKGKDVLEGTYEAKQITMTAGQETVFASSGTSLTLPYIIYTIAENNCSLTASDIAGMNNLSCVVEYKNIGQDNALNTQIKLGLPDNKAVFVSASNNGKTQPNLARFQYDRVTPSIVWDLGTLTPGQQGAVNFTIKIPKAMTEATFGNIIPDSASTIYYDSPGTVRHYTQPMETYISNAVDFSKVGNGAVTVIHITKNIDNPTPAHGDTLTYTLTVTNAGTTAANNVVVSDPLATDLTYVANSASNSGTLSNNTLTWNLGAMAGGATTSLTFKATVN